MSWGWKETAGGLAAAALGAIIAVGAMGGFGGGTDKAATGQVVHDYILDHPEILTEAMNRLRDHQTAQLIAANRDAIETPFAGAIAGNPRGDVTLVEYFDYACGFCKQSVADVDRLVAGDPKLRVVYKELPVLDGIQSDRAAQISLVAARAGRFGAYHHALYAGTGPLTGQRMDAAAMSAGVKVADIDSPAIIDEINANLAAGKALGMTGTPSFVIGDRLLQGAVGYDALKAAVAKARAGQG